MFRPIVVLIGGGRAFWAAALVVVILAGPSPLMAAPPSPPLNSVTHDATLTGAGTTSSPLSVVSPYTGVVHDSSLTGAGTAASPLSVVPPVSPVSTTLTVVDSTGATVGRLAGQNIVALALVSGKAAASFRSTGFVREAFVALYHVTPDCSDVTTRYMDAADVPAQAVVLTDGTAYVPILNQSILTFRSYERFTATDDPNQIADCQPIADYTTLATGYIAVPDSQLGTPPFSIKQ